MGNDIPDAEDISIPSSVTKAGAEARIAEREAGDWTHNDALRELIDEWRYGWAQSAGQQGFVDLADAYERCADELESVIGEGTEAANTQVEEN